MSKSDEEILQIELERLIHLRLMLSLADNARSYGKFKMVYQYHEKMRDFLREQDE